MWHETETQLLKKGCSTKKSCTTGLVVGFEQSQKMKYGFVTRNESSRETYTTWIYNFSYSDFQVMLIETLSLKKLVLSVDCPGDNQSKMRFV